MVSPRSLFKKKKKNSHVNMGSAGETAVWCLLQRRYCRHPHPLKEHTQTYTHVEALLNWTSVQCLFMTTSLLPLCLYTYNRMSRAEFHVCSSRPGGQTSWPYPAEWIFLFLPCVLSFDPDLPPGFVFLFKGLKTQMAEPGFEDTNISLSSSVPQQ